jgi:hypothetical protein
MSIDHGSTNHARVCGDTLTNAKERGGDLKLLQESQE